MSNMSKMVSVLCIFLVGAMILPVGANLLTNPNFESGSTAGWTRWKASWTSGDQAIAQSAVKYEGNYALRMWLTASGSFGVYQQVNVNPGSTYKVSGWWKGTYSGGTNWFEVLLIDGPFNIDQADTPGIASNNFIAAYDPATSVFDWEPISNAYVTTPYIANGTRTATGSVMTVVLKVGGFGTPNVYFDNMVMELVPEPSSLTILAAGLLTFAGVLRRIRQSA